MFCPDCKTEYRPGFSACSDCGAKLVEKLPEKIPTNAPAHAGPELLWTGSNAAVRGVIVNALDDAGIPHHESKREVGPIPGLAPTVYAIFIPSDQRIAARAEMEKAVRELESGARRPDEEFAAAGLLAGSEREDKNEDDGAENEDASEAPDDIPENYDPEQATAEVWSGSDLEMKDMLVASLRENGIGCELEVNGAFRIRVMPSDESRAREIIHEVIDASPPQ
jgi:hypothetical protein